MNVFDFAIKMELDGKTFYEKLAAQTNQVGLQAIFSRLAEDEQKHYEIFQQLKAGGKGVPTMQDSTTLENARNVFEQLIAEKGSSQASGDLEGYKFAMKAEADSFRLYEEAAQKEQDAEVKALLLRIAEEEHKHFNILQNIFQFTNAPNQFLAWGEFSNLDEFRNFGRDVDM